MSLVSIKHLINCINQESGSYLTVLWCDNICDLCYPCYLAQCYRWAEDQTHAEQCERAERARPFSGPGQPFSYIRLNYFQLPSEYGRIDAIPSQLRFEFLKIMCRCCTPLDNSVKEKISMFCHVEPEQVRSELPWTEDTKKFYLHQYKYISCNSIKSPSQNSWWLHHTVSDVKLKYHGPYCISSWQLLVNQIFSWTTLDVRIGLNWWIGIASFVIFTAVSLNVRSAVSA